MQAINPILTVRYTSALPLNSNNTYTPYVYQVLDIDTSRGTGQYITAVYNVSCLQYRKKKQAREDTMSVWRTLRDNSLLDLFMARGVGSATGAPSGAIFASSSTYTPRAAYSSVPYNSSGNFMLRVLSSRSNTTR